ncbi:bifunctional 3'-5' exonuclease/DNA polymerase [uncultured Caudovirales phage]|uniref:Bifunctional 3'-5' exonuclease/DNA polymerase n=1 Tax=uncultured Caudovirales phage TaxID=2100421 RepID=A0A6J7WAB1_9CAUD|nr:bifunctional 3'-5' exonuclease/DNA polymerase [uncultured Caudovirales phage]
MELHVDFETYSAVDLPKRGVDVYAKDATTGVHCIAYSFGEDYPVKVVFGDGLLSGGEEIAPVLEHVAAGGIVVAHNAAFELAIWNHVCTKKYGWPELRTENTRCTMAQAYALALPGSLEKLAPALGLELQKDMRGRRVMLKLSHVDDVGLPLAYADAPDDFEALYSYCANDVAVEMACDARMLKLSAAEQSLWVLDQKINNRGIPIDIATVNKSLLLIDAEQKRLDKAMVRATGGDVPSARSVAALAKWVASCGVAVDGLAKADILMLLDSDLPEDVRLALEIRQEAAKSSTAKLKAMHAFSSADGRVRGALQYHGATTGRWAGRSIQIQNFPRPRTHDASSDEAQEKCISEIVTLLAEGRHDEVDMQYGPPLSAVADAMRGMIKAPEGSRLVVVDYNSIEARVLAWLAGQEDILEVFKSGKDVYCHAAAGIYKREVTKKDKLERQIGKTCVLALGYAGGVGAFQNMARTYGVKVSDDEAEQIKKDWRDANPSIVSYWYALEEASLSAVRHPGEKFYAGADGRQVCFRKCGSALYCRLPSGRVLAYQYPEIRSKKMPWGSLKDTLYFKAVDGVTKQWAECDTYGGSLSENITQAVARDVMVTGLRNLEAAWYKVIFHVHDEIVAEMRYGKGSVEEMVSLMCKLDDWATGLPISAEGFEDERYRK